MSSLHDFLQGKEPEPEDHGVEVELSFMCSCGNSNIPMFTKDSFKTANGVCPDCKAKATMQIPKWLGDMLR